MMIIYIILHVSRRFDRWCESMNW